MSTWSVCYNVYASTIVKVDADTEEEAKKIADKQVHVSVCNHCSRKIEIGDIGEIIEVLKVD